MPARAAGLNGAVLVVCGDAGAGEAVAPVAGSLRARGRPLTVVASPFARPAFERRGFEVQGVERLDVELQASGILERYAPAALVTGASWREQSEGRFVVGARRRAIPALSVLDYWSHYVERFSDETGRLSCLPDRIAVMDERARDEMIAAGIPAARLVVTGSPAFDSLADARRRFDARRRASLRASVQVGPDELLILFVSQPVRRLLPELGYDERQVLGLLAAALDLAAARCPRPLVLGVKPHPRDGSEPYAGLDCAVRRVELPRGDNSDWLLASDLVVGMNSVLLVQACVLGLVAVSVQPGLRVPDTLPTNATGHTLVVRDAKAVAATVERALLDEAFRSAQLARLEGLATPGGAAEHVASVVERLLEDGRPLDT